MLELTLRILVGLRQFLELLVQTRLLFNCLLQFITFLSCLLCELSDLEGEFVFFSFKTLFDFLVVLFRFKFLQSGLRTQVIQLFLSFQLKVTDFVLPLAFVLLCSL